ncbi:hypothetical protein HMPREF1623_03658, partial [Escherichia coli 910096-2]
TTTLKLALMGVIPATLQVLAYLQRTLVFTLACPRAGFWGG